MYLCVLKITICFFDLIITSNLISMQAILLNAYDLEINGYTIFSHDPIENNDLGTGDHEMSINYVTSHSPQEGLNHK